MLMLLYRVPSVFAGYGDALLFDSNKQPKPAYYAVASALAAATVTGVSVTLAYFGVVTRRANRSVVSPSRITSHPKQSTSAIRCSVRWLGGEEFIQFLCSFIALKAFGLRHSSTTEVCLQLYNFGAISDL